MKKYYLVAVIVLIGLIILVAAGYIIFRSKKTTKVSIPQQKTTTRLIKDLPLDERPYISLTPSSDGHWVTLELSNVKEGDEVEYEIIYEKETKDGQLLEQGVIGHGLPNGGVYNTGKRLFGTESAGKYSFDQVIDGKTLTVKIRRGDEVFKFETDWRLFKGARKLVSADGHFTFEGDLIKGSFYIVHETAGVPEPLPGNLAASPYGIFTSGSTIAKQGEVTFDQAAGTEKIFGWIDNDWQEIIDDSVNKITTFVLIAPNSQ